MKRNAILLAFVVIAIPFAGAAHGQKTSLADSVAWLKQEAHRIIRASKRTMKDGTAAFPPQVGIGYEAFWLRDYEYTLEGAVDAYSDEELLAACRLFVSRMREDGAGVDCVKFDGTSIYKPGYYRETGPANHCGCR